MIDPLDNQCMPDLLIALRVQNKPLENNEIQSCNYWIADSERAFVKAKIISEEGSSVLLETDDKQLLVPRYALSRANASRFEMCEDNANLPELSEATVLENLLQRYRKNLIYTNSGLFLIAINPYQHFPGYYDDSIMRIYSKNATNLPPHIFGIVDKAYKSMLAEGKSQSILIT